MFRLSTRNILINKKTFRPAGRLTMLRRWISIKTVSTPNENALKFISMDGELFQDRGAASIEIRNTDDKLIGHSKLAKRLFMQCSGVESLMIGDNFITINKDELVHWNQVSPNVIDLLTQHLASGDDVISNEFNTVNESNEVGYDIKIPKFNLTEEDQEISDMIDELIQTRIRPAIVDDGGDIQYRGYNPENGTVYLKLQGACKSCSSSEDTLKYGIESMLKHYVEEVQEVVQLLDPEEEIALKEFERLEQKLQSKKDTKNITY